MPSIDKGRITGFQFMYALACLLQSSALLTSFLSSITYHDSWISVLLGIIVCLPLMLLYRGLMVMFPGRNLFEMLDQVYGKVAGSALSVLYIWFVFTLASVNMLDLGTLAQMTIMPQTPPVVLLVSGMLVSTIAVRNGVKLVVLYGRVFTMVAFVILGSSLLLVLNQVNFENFLPMLTLPLGNYLHSTHIISTIPFGEAVVLLILGSNIKLTPKEATKYWLLGFALGAITLLCVIVRDIGALGNTQEMFTLPHLMTLRLVHLGIAMNRTEILFAIVLITLMFFKITLLYYASVIGIAHVLKIRSFKNLALAAGSLMVGYALTLYPCPVQHTLSGQNTVPILWTLFEMLIPLVTLAVAKIQKRAKPAEV